MANEAEVKIYSEMANAALSMLDTLEEWGREAQEELDSMDEDADDFDSDEQDRLSRQVERCEELASEVVEVMDNLKQFLEIPE